MFARFPLLVAALFAAPAAGTIVAGVPVIFGTDAGAYEQDRNAAQFAQLADMVGMSQAGALAAAGAADLLGIGRTAS